MNAKDYILQNNIKKWNIFFIIVFMGTMILFYKVLYTTGKLPETISILNLCIITLAVFRMIRLFVYDNVFLFIREGLMDTVEEHGYYSFVESKNSLKATLYKLATCPWCMGVWISLCSLFVFLMIPNSYFLFLFLAIASFASILQLLANNIGWHAEYRKVQVIMMTKKSE